jgi:hypothetical protein
MTYHQTNQGAGFGSIHKTTTQNSTLSSSLLNTPFAPAGQKPPSSKNFQCKWENCGRWFSSPHNVAQHVREKHTGETPHECQLCLANGVFSGFARPHGLTRHMDQVHSVGTRPSRPSRAARAARAATSTTADAFGGAAVAPVAFQWVDPADPSQIVEDDEFAEFGALLAGANAEMGAASGDVEMSDFQFQFDSGLSNVDVSENHNNNVIACGECDYSAANQENILMHLHATHGVINTPFCSCSICTAMFLSSEEAAVNHAISLGNGAFQVEGGAGFSQEGPDANIDPALLSFSYA